MKKQILVLAAFFVPVITQAQTVGENHDPYAQGKGLRPYEMQGRIEERTPLMTFEDCTQWTVETKGAEAALYRSNDQLLYRNYVGKLRYRATSGQSEIIIRPLKPIALDDSWDCVNFWNYGAHWLWGEPNYKKALQHFLMIEDSKGELHDVNFVQSGYKGMIHKYWFLNHIKIPESISRPIRVVGIKFTGREVTDEKPLSIYLGPIYAYKEELKPLTYEEYPTTLPFPNRKTTILPIQKNKDYKNATIQQGKHVTFTYEGDDTKFSYNVSLAEDFPFGISLTTAKGKKNLLYEGRMDFAAGEAQWYIQKSQIARDTLFVTAAAKVKGQAIPFHFYYTLQQKTLIISMDEQSVSGQVESIHLGSIYPAEEARLFSVPFLVYNYQHGPKIVYSDDLFYFMQFDWYYTNASAFSAGFQQIEDKKAYHNEGVKYIPKTNGERNPVRERLFINVSADVQEVLPTIPNPKSPMRSLQADRLWRINGDPDHGNLKQEADNLRSLGIEKLSIRYHEGLWRDGGESYTFKLDAAPGRGGNKALKELVSYVKSKGWRVGLYTNYTDHAPVNANWDEDWVMHGPNGEWQVSWSRCFAPKPMKSLEVQRINAPIIHQRYGANHSYCDVHTAVSPMSRVDYDFRVPGAATFRRTFEVYGQILLNEKKAYRGPVYSEGGNHWWYAGLVDGNYANTRPKLNKRPVFPEFQLLKIHPLEMDAGNVYATGSEYLAYTLAYGNIGICDGSEVEMMKRYFMLQPIQNYYSMIPVKSIQYENNGKLYSSSQALVQGLNEKAHLVVTYENGFKTGVNFDDKPWEVEINGRKIQLLKHGFYAATSDNTTISFSALTEENQAPVDISMSQDSYYFDSKGKYAATGSMTGKGTVAMKNERFGWEVIPARSFEEFGFDPSIINLPKTNLTIEPLGKGGLTGVPISTRWSRGKLYLLNPDNQNLKYRVVPQSGMPPHMLRSSSLRVSSRDKVEIDMPDKLTLDIASLQWQIHGRSEEARYYSSGQVKVPELKPDDQRLWLQLKTKTGEEYWIDFLVD